MRAEHRRSALAEVDDARADADGVTDGALDDGAAADVSARLDGEVEIASAAGARGTDLLVVAQVGGHLW